MLEPYRLEYVDTFSNILYVIANPNPNPNPNSNPNPNPSLTPSLTLTLILTLTLPLTPTITPTLTLTRYVDTFSNILYVKESKRELSSLAHACVQVSRVVVN